MAGEGGGTYIGRRCEDVREAADVPGMFDEPGHFLGRDCTGGDDEITLVLPALVVHYDEKFAAREGVDRIFYRVEREALPDGDVQYFLGTRRRRRGGYEWEV